MQIETMTIDGQKIPVITSSAYLVDFGPTPQSGRSAWFDRYRVTLTEVGQREFGGLPVPMEILAQGRTGRVVLRIFAPDPDRAVYEADRLSDGEGPKVVAL